MALLGGKRSDYSGRSVISPAADISVTAVEVPRAMGLRKTDRVTSLNLPRLQEIFDRSVRAARGLLERDEMPEEPPPVNAKARPVNEGTAFRAGTAFGTGMDSGGDQEQRKQWQGDGVCGTGRNGTGEEAEGQRNGRMDSERNGEEPGAMEGWGGGTGWGHVGGGEKRSSGEGGSNEQRKSGAETERNEVTENQPGLGGGTGWGDVGGAEKQTSGEVEMDEQLDGGTETERNADTGSQPEWGEGLGSGDRGGKEEPGSADGITTECPQRTAEGRDFEGGRGRTECPENAAEEMAWATERTVTGWQETNFQSQDDEGKLKEAEQSKAFEATEATGNNKKGGEERDNDCADIETGQQSAGKGTGKDEGRATGWGEPGAWGMAAARDDVSNRDDVSPWPGEAVGGDEGPTGWGSGEGEKLNAKRNERSGEDGWGAERPAPEVGGDSQTGARGEGVAKKETREERDEKWKNGEKPSAPNRPVRPFDGQIIQFRRNGIWRKVALVSPGQFELRVGDVIDRLLTDGDLVVWNRNPSVRQHNVLASRVKLTECKSIGLPLPLCHACNGDFDGDEVSAAK